MAKAKKPTTTSASPAEPYQRTDIEAQAVAEQTQRRKTRLKAPEVKVDGKKNGVFQIVPDHPDHLVWQTALERVFGSNNPAAIDLLLAVSVGTVWSQPDQPPSVKAMNSLLAIMHGINPVDEIEAMMASQMTAMHLAAMECLRRAQVAGQTLEGRDMNLRHVTKLSRTFTAQVEALAKYRGKGQQKVVVEHVHVHAGGQAIVGHVSPGAGPRGEGGTAEIGGSTL